MLSTYLLFFSNSSNDSIEAPHYQMKTPLLSSAHLLHLYHPLLPMVVCSAEPGEMSHQKTCSYFVTQQNVSSKMLHRCYYRHQLVQNKYHGFGATMTLSCCSIHIVVNSYWSHHQHRWQKRRAVFYKYKYYTKVS